MKKNTMMRLASALLVLVLLTTCAISGTFAKYTSTTSGDDTARVAYWGFAQDGNNFVTIDDLFLDTYTNVNVDSDTTDTVDGLIAPGTSNSATFGFAYKNNTTVNVDAPEVAYTFVVDTTGSECDEAIQNNTNITWSLTQNNDGDDDVVKLDNGTWTELIAAIKALSGDTSGTKQYAANQLPADFAPGTSYTVAWAWAFETADNAETDTDEMADQDVIDTTMGNADLLDVNLTITITATQVD